jgi:hypothetical protein
MQIVALASGNPLTGALSMFLFSAGTVPLMLGLGSAAAALGRKFAGPVMALGAALVVVLGFAMLSQGGGLSGLLSPDLLFAVVVAICAAGIVSCLDFPKPSYKAASAVAASAAVILLFAAWNGGGSGGGPDPGAGANEVADGRQSVTSTLSPRRYPDITVRAGVPVTWVIDAPEGSVNGCNYRLIIPEYGVSHDFSTGENIIEFTPESAGNFRYSCWMGMIRGTIAVTEDGDASTT